jgi:hypothetical protein
MTKAKALPSQQTRPLQKKNKSESQMINSRKKYLKCKKCTKNIKTKTKLPKEIQERRKQ